MIVVTAAGGLDHGTVCRLVGGDWQEHEIDAGLAERLRIVVNGSNAYGAMADCSTTPTDPAYVVSLADRTGTRRSFTVDVRDCS